MPIRQIELARAKAKVEADTTLGQAEKQKQLAELDRKLADLGQPTAKQALAADRIRHSGPPRRCRRAGRRHASFVLFHPAERDQ